MASRVEKGAIETSPSSFVSRPGDDPSVEDRTSASDQIAPVVDILGYRVDRLGLEATAMRCRDIVVHRKRSHHVSLNAAKLVRAQDDARLAQILDAAELVNADGQSIVWAARLLGTPLPERVPGIDLMFRLLEIAEADGFRVYFLGSRVDVLQEAIKKLRNLHPGLAIAGSHHGYFGTHENAAMCTVINSANVDILFVAMSSPQKEYWVEECRSLLDAPLIVGIGGALDVVAGVVNRAPIWMQKTGLEWFFRFLQEPARMWRRYLVTNTRFVALLAGTLTFRMFGNLRRRPSRSS